MANEIDKTSVERTIDRFIQNDGQVNIYVEAPQLETLAKNVRAREIGPKPLTNLIFSPHVVWPADVLMAFSYLDMTRIQFRTDYLLDKIEHEGRQILFTAKCWDSTRYAENNPKYNGFWGRIFHPTFWLHSPQESFDRKSSEFLQRAYNWIQEQTLLEQRDLKNWYAIQGFRILEVYNQRPETKQRVPLNEFVAEQVRRIPQKILKKHTRCVKWANGERAFDFHAPIREIYGEQLQQLA